MLQVFQSNAPVRCMLSSAHIVLELKAKKENLVVREFKYKTPEPSDIVECLYKTALHACDLLALERHFYSLVYTI